MLLPQASDFIGVDPSHLTHGDPTSIPRLLHRIGSARRHLMVKKWGWVMAPWYRAGFTPSHSWVKMDVNNPQQKWITIAIDPYPNHFLTDCKMVL